MFEEEKSLVFSSIMHFYKNCKDAIMKIFDSVTDETEYKHTLYNLAKFIGERSIAVSILSQNDLLWDAQILMRSIQEATMKFSFLCICDEEEKKQRLKEYLYDLEEINSLKRSEIAKAVLSTIKNKEDAIPFLPLVLEPDRETELKEKWNAKKRGKLEQKWLYASMMKDQSKKFPQLADQFLSLAHPYRMSSHLLHADETGIGIIAERSLRKQDEIGKVELSHFCSIQTELLNYLIICGFSVCNAFGQDPSEFKKILSDVTPLFKIISEQFQAPVYDDSSYNKYRV